MSPGGMRPSFRGWPAQGDHLVLVHVWLVRHLSHRVPSQVDPPQGGTVRGGRPRDRWLYDSPSGAPLRFRFGLHVPFHALMIFP